jgi:TolB protein
MKEKVVTLLTVLAFTLLLAPAASLLVPGASLLVPAALHAQDPPPGVRIGLDYDPRGRPGVVVMPMNFPAGDSLRAIIQRDLGYGNRVLVLDLGDSLALPVRGEPNYALFRDLNATNVIHVVPLEIGIRVALHDASVGQVTRTHDFPLPLNDLSPDWRMAVHGVADEIERWITGVRGIAQSRIAYVKDGRVWVIDSDGANDHPVTPGMSPSWHPDGGMLAYQVQQEDGSHIYVRNLRTGHASRVSSRTGLNQTPTFSPDGRSIVWGHGQEAGTDLWIAALDGSGARRVTVGRGSDNMMPSFSPDGQRIAFISARLGNPDVFLTDVDGANLQQLTPFTGRGQFYRAGPEWSPDGRNIVYTSRIGGIFQIEVAGVRGDRSARQVTADGENSDPSWAPDSRHIVFTSNRSGVSQLWVHDTETNRSRQLTRAGGRLSAWSPHLGTP